MRILAVIALWSLLATLSGCGGEPQQMVPVPLDQLPAGSLEAANKARPGLKFERARKAKFDGKDSIELIGKDKNGKTVEVELSLDGKVLEIE